MLKVYGRCSDFSSLTKYVSGRFSITQNGTDVGLISFHCWTRTVTSSVFYWFSTHGCTGEGSEINTFHDAITSYAEGSNRPWCCWKGIESLARRKGMWLRSGSIRGFQEEWKRTLAQVQEIWRVLGVGTQEYNDTHRMVCFYIRDEWVLSNNQRTFELRRENRWYWEFLTSHKDWPMRNDETCATSP